MTIAARILGLSGTRDAPSAAPVAKKAQRPQVATGNVGWAAPGSPMYSEWDADSAIQMGYYGYIYAYRCARTIATTIAGLPYRAGADANSPGVFDLRSPLAQLLGPPPGGPAPNISPRQLWIHSIVSYLITGRWAWETPTATGSNAPVSLWPLIVSKLKPIPSSGGTDFFTGFEYNLNARVQPMTVNQVFYAWRPSQKDWRQPESALQAMALPLSLGVALDRFMTSFMKNSMVSPKMVITPGFEDEGMRRAFQDQFLAEMTGYDNAGRTSFAEYEDDGAQNGQGPPNVQVIDLGTKPVDAEITALQKWVRDTVCDGFGVPVSIVGQASERTYENADQEHRNYWTGTILGLIEELQDLVNLGLAPRFDGNDVGWWDLSGVAALKPAARFMQVSPIDLKNAEMITTAEWREDVALPPTLPPEGDPDPQEPVPAIDDTPGMSGGSTTGGASAPRVDDKAATELPAAIALEDVVVAHYDVSKRGFEGERYDVSPLGTGKNWVTDTGGLDPFIRAIAHALERNGHTESEAIQLAVGVVKRWASGAGNVTAKTRAKAAAAVAHWEAQKAAAQATPNQRDIMTENGATGAGDLLPKAGKPMLVPHLPVPGEERGICAACGQKTNATIHRVNRKHKSPVRHAGPAGHAHVKTGHHSAARRTVIREVDEHATAMEPAVSEAMKHVFAKQRKATLNRLAGNRGKSMLRTAQPPDDDKSGPAPLVDAGQVFDWAHWVTETEAALKPFYASVAVTPQPRLAKFTPTDGSTASVVAALRARSTNLAQTVSTTTLEQIQKALGDAIVNGDTIAQMTQAINAVFDEADTTRAQMIARTESLGAINAAADAHATALGPDVVAGKEWAATHDTRTRETHRAADGQIRSMALPYTVGGFPMTGPGDPAAPPDETVNCRCCSLYLTPAEYAQRSGIQLPTASPIAA